MTNPAGTYAETHCARWLTDELGVKFERIVKHGNRDEGDLRAHELPWLCVEVKNRKALSLATWGKELAAEVTHADANYGVVLWSPPGVGVKNIGQWIALEWDDSWLRPSANEIPHVGPLNKLHKFVTLADGWGDVVMTAKGGAPASVWDINVRAQLAHSWLVDVRERMAVTA